MRLSYVEFENIKSYCSSTRVDLTAGLNAVCGHNGSGKSTILEAIGFGLFDFLPYPQASFLREGSKTGTIRLGLIAKDERQYEIVRRIGSGSAYFVSDLETGTRLAERTPAVLEWIAKQGLDLDGDLDLKALFENAVGVPQGLMTADFQQGAAVRKGIFDPLLRVEEYREAVEYLRDAVGYVRDEIAELEKRLAALGQDVKRMPELAAEAERLGSDLRARDEEASELTQQRDQLSRERENLDTLAKLLADLDARQQESEAHVRRETERLQERADRLEHARQARTLTLQAELGYTIVKQARDRLNALEEKRTERDKLREDLHRAEAEVRERSSKVDQLEQSSSEAKQAQAEVETLADAVETQQQLEDRLHELRLQAREGEQLVTEIRALEETAGASSDAVKALEAQIDAARAAEMKAKQLGTLRAQRDAVAQKLAVISTVREQMAVAVQDGKELKTRSEEAEAAVVESTHIRERITEVREVAQRLPALEKARHELNNRLAGVRAAIEYQAIARSDLTEGKCPLLDLACPVVASEGSSLDRLQGRDQDLKRQLGEIQEAIAESESAVNGAKRASEEMTTLTTRLAGLEPVASKVETLREQLAASRQRYAQLQAQVNSEAALQTELGDLEARLRQVEKDAQLAAQLPTLENQARRESELLVSTREALAGLKARQVALTGAQQEEASLTRRLAEMGDPKARRLNLIGVASRSAGIEANLADERGQLEISRNNLQSLISKLDHFLELDKELQEQRRKEEEHREAYDLYLQNQSEAAQVEERAAAVGQLEAELEQLRANLKAIEGQRAEAAEAYDSVRHAELRVQCEEVSNQLIRMAAERESKLAVLSKLQDELLTLRTKEDELGAAQEERSKLESVVGAIGFIRETIKTAGPVVTENLLQSISQGASEIYADIMSDHASELSWDRDYEVVVRRGPDERKFVQLSGGEQMSAALAVRLALLKEMSDIDFAFFDEPTQNMDQERRTNLADQIRQVRGFEQLIVISHDDTFEQHTDNLIRLSKVDEETRVELGA